ncbi:MAG: DEAD/DEAH box helicase [Ruminococcaceae bacterium]|nr:DEAD/DEAH box helicase [Oscillospiraceae bacterium]
MTVFNRFAPIIRDYIYENGWHELRPVQTRSAEVIFDSEDNLLICSSTASGKTEAVFFPIISSLLTGTPHMSSGGFSVLYIAPLKSLINDQYRRISDLLSLSEIPVTHWHGDVGTSHKKKALKDPRGILQITPESLESMLINRHSDIVSIFGALEFVIIDEMHSMMNADRGLQVLCQISRIESILGRDIRRIGLSATIGDTAVGTKWLSGGSSRETVVLTDEGIKKRWRVATEHFFVHDRSFSRRKAEENAGEKSINTPSNVSIEASGEEIVKEGEKPKSDAGYEFIYKCIRNKSCIVFSNSREETEFATATLRQIAKRQGDPERVLIHHGNLSAALREDAEDKLKQEDDKYTVCATVTLELGIDIGQLERIVQIESPSTVAGFLQRLGRSGRRDAPPEVITVIREEEPLPNAPIGQLIPWSLLRSIAIIKLYTEERFIEPPRHKLIPLSLAFQQILSLLMSDGEMKPSTLAHRILSMPPFENIPRDVLKSLMSFMVEKDFMEKTENGGLIVGLEGEKITSSFKFYAAFKDSEDFTVRSGSEEIGTISSCPPIGERFALAGRAWEIEETDLARRLIYVKPIDGKLEVSWPGDHGEIHTRILEKMRQVLTDSSPLPYLKPNAAARLEEARMLARNAGLGENLIVRLGGDSYCFFPWLGTRAFRTMLRVLGKYAHDLGISAMEHTPYYITFKMRGANEKSFLEKLRRLIRRDGGIDAHSLVGKSESPAFDKYDPYLPSDLLRIAFASDRLDPDEVLTRIFE